MLSGISLGGQYALIAIGYTMVYGILRLINFAHGDVFMCAGLMMVFMCASLPVYVSIPLMLVLTVLLGFVIERAAYKPLRSAPRMSVMISAIGVSYLLQNVALYATGGQPQTYPSLPFVSDTVTILGATTHCGHGRHACARARARAAAAVAHQPHQDRHGHARGREGLRDQPAHGHPDQ